MTSPLEHTHWLPLLGLPLELRTNSRALSDVLDWEQPLGGWAHLPPALIAPVPTLQIDVLLGEAHEQIGGMRLFRHGQTALAGDGPRLLMAQTERGYGMACLPAEPLGDAIRAIWELGALLARGHGRVPVQAAALELNGRGVLLIGATGDPLLAACAARGLRLLARNIVHISDGAGDLRIWGDGAGGDLLSCTGPVTVCLLERGAGRASQIIPQPAADVVGLDEAARAVRAAYRLHSGGDLEMAAALIEHVT
ncbi:hypothetical protein EKD04_020085 [Chloroflexales bacterium ZM16-3]|nr:hypothetical protein [Chloroflexales bacterium ZM16-3]